MRFGLLTLLLIAGGGLALPATPATSAGAATSPAPTAVTASLYLPKEHRTVEITGLNRDGLDQFLGIPYAAPPVGNLRFRRPKPATYGDHVDATHTPPSCMQVGNVANMTEDCLSVSVLAPPGAAAGKEKLPVMVWIYGGGFVSGNQSQYLYPFLPSYGIKTKRPFILVTMNYRLAIWGFPTGRDAAAHKAGNLGLYDQRLALQWVQAHIGAFGGDPRRVTLFGESAGAISVAMHMLDPKQELFSAAIMESGVQQATSTGLHIKDLWQDKYDELLVLTGCDFANATRPWEKATGKGNKSKGKGKGKGKDKWSGWECLRAMPPSELLASVNTLKAKYPLPFFWQPGVDGDLVRSSPHALLRNGKFARVPFITGNNVDEGTLFTALSPIPVTAANLVEQIRASFSKTLPDKFINKLLAVYPADPAAGSPFNTGNNTFGHDPSYKRYAAIMGDIVFVAGRRTLLRAAAHAGWAHSWSYEWASMTPGAPPDVGFTHGAEIAYVFGAAQAAFGYSSAAERLGEAMMSYWINFAYSHTPNGAGNATFWPPYGDKRTMFLGEERVEPIADTFRLNATDYLLSEEAARAIGW